MSRAPVLYIGAATPLVERAREWTVDVPGATAQARQQALATFPALDDIGAYRLATSEGFDALCFRTGRQVNQARVGKALQGWQPDAPIEWVDRVEPIQPIDHRQGIAGLREALSGLPVAIEVRIGLTLQALQRDLARLRPELLLLYCHGTEEGCLVFEDGRGVAEYVSGARLFGLFGSRPRVLVLNACYSGTVLARAKERADWRDATIVSIDPATPLEVGAGTAFQSMFYQGLLGGQPAGAAFEAAQRYVANDVHFGDLSVPADETPPSRKFRLHPGGESVALVPLSPATGASEARPETPHVRRIRRSSDRFVGRREELACTLDALLPLPAGVRRAGPGRVVTLTKEGGIGKTAMAGELADWCVEREVFSGGVYELACETYASAAAFLSRLLEVSGVPLAEHCGDLMALLRDWFSRRFPAEQPALLLLDNLDDLFARGSPARIEAGRLIEAALESAPFLRILATCRWPLGLTEHERPIEVPPLRADEARDVFIENLVAPAHQSEVRVTWGRSDSAARELIDKLSGRHPHALVLLARQMGRRGMTLGRLREEARADLIEVLADPLAGDDEQDRMKKAEVSYGLSYRHLSEPAKRLFERLSRFPGGVWCGEPAHLLPWDALLGEGWRVLIEKELDYFALMRWEPDPEIEGSGRYVMLTSMLEFARKKYREADHTSWDAKWVAGWLDRIQVWKDLVRAHIPEHDRMPRTPEDRARFGRALRVGGTRLFVKTQANWLAAFEHVCDMKGGDLRPWRRSLYKFLTRPGQQTLGREVSRRALEVLNQGESKEERADWLCILGNALNSLGEPEQGRRMLEEALGIDRDLAETDPAHQAIVAITLNELAVVLRERGMWDVARQYSEKALAIYDSLGVSQHAANVASTLVNLGAALGELGEWKQARHADEKALEILMRLAAEQPAEYEPDLATALNNLGVVRRKSGDTNGARTALEQAKETRRGLAEADWTEYAPNLATTLNNLGNLLGEDLHDWEGACQAHEGALAIRRRLAREYPGVYEPNVVISLSNLGGALRQRGMLIEARTVFADAVDIYRPWAKARPEVYAPKLAAVLSNLGVVLKDSGEREAARGAFKEALSILGPLSELHPKAFGANFRLVLGHYVEVAVETSDDPWWRRAWRKLLRWR